MMLGDPARCATHKTVLTSGGTCLLCIRRVGDPSDASSSTNILPWATGLVFAGLVVLAVVFKIYLSVSDKHPAQAATAEPTGTAVSTPLPTTVSTSSAIPGSDGTDRASLLAEAKRDVVIDLYGASWCGYCSRERAYLDREGIAYNYHDVDQPSNKTPLRQLNPRGSVPTTKVDDQVLVGFSEPSMRRAIDHAAQSRVARKNR
jgi:mycoredoxin